MIDFWLEGFNKFLRFFSIKNHYGVLKANWIKSLQNLSILRYFETMILLWLLNPFDAHLPLTIIPRMYHVTPKHSFFIPIFHFITTMDQTSSNTTKSWNFPAEVSEWSNCPPPRKLRQILEHKSFTYITLSQDLLTDCIVFLRSKYGI